MSARSTKVIALFDVLGFESLLRSRGLDWTLDVYAKLTQVVDAVQGSLCVFPVPNGDGTHGVGMGFLALEKTYFSDTILVWCEYEEYKFPAFCNACSEFFCRSLELSIPLRGALAVGDVNMDAKSGVFVGQALVDAARGETAQRWLGISLCRSFAVEPYCHFSDPQIILPYRAHQKRDASFAGLLPGMVLDWPRHWRESRTRDVRPLIADMNTQPQNSKYYENSIRFVDFSEKQHDWWLKKRSSRPNRNLANDA